MELLPVSYIVKEGNNSSIIALDIYYIMRRYEMYCKGVWGNMQLTGLEYTGYHNWMYNI